MTNGEVAALLTEMGVLLQVAGGNPFKIRAYERAAFAVASYPKPVCGLSEKELQEIPGIGASIAAHIKHCGAGGSFAELDELRKKFPAGLLDLLRIPGLGPKRARFLFQEARIDSLDALRAAIEAGRLQGLRGFGEKIVENIRAGLSFAAEKPRLLHWEARKIGSMLLEAARRLPGVERAELAGSLRRGRETVGDLDILCASKHGPEVTAAFAKLEMFEKVLGCGDTKTSVLLAGGVQCDLRVVAPESFGAALQYFTGSKDHNVALREWALKRGLTVNEYGVFKLSDKKQTKPVAGKTEEDVYKSLGLAWISPELRESRGEIQAAAVGKLPRLIERKDIRGDFHNHTTHTDGRDSMEAMARAARERGWEWIAIGDHSQALAMTGGLNVQRLRASFREMERLRSKVKGIELLRSMEVDILEDGAMDYPDPVLNEIDVVIGSVHSRFKQSSKEMTERLCRAASNPHVDIIGHLSGRLINRRPPYDFDAERVLQTAAKAGTAIEINGQPDRQDIDDVRARRLKELGGRMAVDSDAHSTREYDFVDMAITIARRAWLEPKDVLNCMTLKELRAWLDRRGRS